MATVDKMRVEILDDGTIKFTTDPISGANHANADEALDFVARLSGGETTREAREDAVQSHDHEHTHEHEHGGGGHHHH